MKRSLQGLVIFVAISLFLTEYLSSPQKPAGPPKQAKPEREHPRPGLAKTKTERWNLEGISLEAGEKPKAPLHQYKDSPLPKKRQVDRPEESLANSKSEAPSVAEATASPSPGIGKKSAQNMRMEAEIREFLKKNRLPSPRAVSATALDDKAYPLIYNSLAGYYSGILTFPDDEVWYIQLDVRIYHPEPPLEGLLDLRILDVNRKIVMESQLRGSLSGVVASVGSSEQNKLSMVLVPDKNRKSKILQMFFDQVDRQSVVIGNFYQRSDNEYGRAVPFVLTRQT
jgi:hypothetical protein